MGPFTGPTSLGSKHPVPLELQSSVNKHLTTKPDF